MTTFPTCARLKNEPTSSSAFAVPVFSHLASLIIDDSHCYPRPGHCHHVIRVLSERGEENQRGQAPDDDTCPS